MALFNANLLDMSLVAPAVLDNLPLGITLVDPDGIITYYNEFAARELDRKPEYIGRDVREYHRKDKSIAAIDRLLREFKDGRDEIYVYEGSRNGNRIKVTIGPLRSGGRFLGCIHTVALEKQ